MTETAAPAEVGARGEHPLSDAVLRVVADVRAAAVADGEAAAAAALDLGIARLRRSAAGVVVVGEKKRGKSSLINALVLRADLLAVDADVATCVHVVVSHGDHPLARVVDADGTRPIEFDEVAEYAAIDPATRSPHHDGVVGVEVEVPSPLLARGLELVDTPGVGGLVAGHAALTLATLERADALLFVLDGQSEITSSELAFLVRATERILAVAFVVTKTDVFPEWRTVLARSRALVAEHAPQYADAPWFPVSGHARFVAEEARAAGRFPVAARQLAASGLVELESHLGTLAATADGLRLSEVLHQAIGLAKRLSAAQVRRAFSLNPSPEFAAAVAAEKARLTELEGRNATWRARLTASTTRAEQNTRTELTRHLEDLRKEVGDTIAVGGRSVFEDAAKDLPPRVRAIWVELDTILRRELGRATESLLADLAEVEVDLSGVVPDLPPDRVAHLPEAVRGKGGTTFAEHGVMAMSLGMMVGTLITSMTGLAPVGVAAGVAVVGFFTHRRHAREVTLKQREAARRYLAEVSGRLATEFPPIISQAVAAARALLSEHVSAALAAEKERLEASLAEHRRNATSAQAALDRAKADVEQRLRERKAMRETGMELAARLGADRRDGPSPATADVSAEGGLP